MNNVVYTVGHSTHTMEKFLELLKLHQITALGDVRSSPYSRFNPQFNREVLQAALRKSGIAYVFLGRELGARTDDESCYVDGKVQYDLLAQTQPFQDGLTRVVSGSQTYRIALMCAEKDPLTCHRTILVCRHLVERGVTVQHILEDGQIESHDEALARLLAEEGLVPVDLFQTREEIILDAYAQRGQQIAYTKRPPTEEPLEELLG
jgi:uncharacterized protein (DUF488 family)